MKEGELEPEEVAFIQRINAVFLSKEIGFEEALREYRRIEVEFVARAGDNEYHVVETRRRVTEWLLKHAYKDDQSQEVCREIWQEMLQRGFADIERRLMMSGIYVRCCQYNGAFDEGLAIIEPLIAETEQLLEAEGTTLTPAMRFDCEQLFQTHRKIRDELKAGIRE